MKIYHDKAHVYHELYEEIFDYEKEFSLFHNIMQKQDRPIKKILELGCGSGSVTRYLANDYECIGLDFSPDMIKLAKNLVPNAEFVQGDMRYLPLSLNNQFDAVLSTGRSFTHLTTNKDCLECCESVMRVLKPGGLFIFDNFKAEVIFTDFKSNMTHKSKNITRISSNSKSFEHGFTWNWHAEYHINDVNGKELDKFEDNIVLRAFTGNEMELILSIAGFSDIYIKTDEENPVVLISMAKKPI
jgi:ubiquinone/menaquinone biosynthesis C-methylase UbiE